MFRYTDFPGESAQPQNPPKIRTKNTSIPKPMQSLERPLSGSCAGRSSSPQKDNDISERYTNKTYNRLPSPKGRFQTLANAAKDRPPFVAGKSSPVDKERRKPSGRVCERKQPPKSPRPLPVKQSCSDVISRRRPLKEECKTGNVQAEVDVKTRPKTSNCTKESRLEHKVLNRVERVLSRALLQQGKIDETNFENVITSMRNSLYLEKNEDEELSEIDIESKPSRTTVNEINISEEHSAVKKTKHGAGIIRRDNLSINPEPKPYRKIYAHTESPSMNKTGAEDDDKTFVCVDLPDLVFPGFPSSMKSDRKSELKPNVEITASKQNMRIETTVRDAPLKQFEVGDFQTKENHFWTSSEDAKLHEYIESLINNMKNQANCGKVIETEGEIDSQGTICRSFCVCKVCIENTKPGSALKQKPSRAEEPVVVNVEKPKPRDSKFQRPVTREAVKPPKQREAGNRLRLLKPPSKGTEANSPCKVIKNTNPNFKPESSINTSLSKNVSYTVVEPGNSLEDSDDMYLQRRIRKAPSRKPSAKLN